MTATLAEPDNDITKYIIYIKNNLKMITHASANTDDQKGLLTYIFGQLKLCSIPLFQNYACHLHIAYQEGKHTNLTSSTLLEEVENKVRVLKHAKEWMNTSNPHPPAMALYASGPQPTNLEKLILLQTQLLTKLLTTKHNKNDSNAKPYNKWKHDTHANLNDTKTVNGKVFKWCTKCNHGKGQWVSAHDTSTHIEGCRRDKTKHHNTDSKRPGIPCSATQGYSNSRNKPQANVSNSDKDADNTDIQDRVNLAQIDLANSLNWRLDVSEDQDE